MQSLPLYTVKERRPEHDETIVVFGTHNSLGADYIEIPFVTVEYQWVQLDESGDDTGTAYVYNGMDNKPEGNIRLILLDTNDGSEIFEDIVYAKMEDIDNLYQLMNK